MILHVIYLNSNLHCRFVSDIAFKILQQKLGTKHCVQHITHKFDQALTLQSALLDFFLHLDALQVGKHFALHHHLNLTLQLKLST